MPPPFRFLRAWLIASLALLALVAGFNALIDPYAVFGTPRIAGLNAFKTASATHAALSKTYEVERIRPRTVLIGSSTVDIGLDPEDPIWPKDLRPVFDYGVPGSLPPFQYRTLQQAAAAGTLKQAIIVLSFLDALQPPAAEGAAGRRPTDDQRRLLVTVDGQDNPARMIQELKDTFLSTLTLSTLGDSVATVLSQWQPDALDLTEHGSTTEGAFRRVAKAEGYATLFELKEEEYARKLGMFSRQQDGANGRIYWLDSVEQMLAFCRSRHIRPVFVIAPSHADMLDLIDKTGFWRTFEAWKVALADLVQRDKSAGAVLWDFTGYDQYSTEEVPPRGANASAMRWFWEPVHFKKSLGNIVLRRILLGDPTGFGTPLAPDNVQAALAAIRSARQAYWDGGGASASRVSSVVARVSRTDGPPTF